MGPRWLVPVLLVWGFAGACGQPFLRSDPPVRSRGISVGLVDQECDRMMDPNWSSADMLGLDVRLRVVNASAGDVAFDPDRVRLLAGGQARTPYRADSRRTVSAGTAAIFGVHFLEKGDNLACDVPMALSIDGAAASGAAPLSFSPIQFLIRTGDI